LPPVGESEKVLSVLSDHVPNAGARATQVGEGSTVVQRHRSRVRIALVLLLQLVCIAYVARLLWNHRAELHSAWSLSGTALLALTALMFVAHLQRTYEFTYMLRTLGVREPFLDGFLLTGAGFLLNHLPLSAGLLMRAAVLKRDYALSYATYLSLVTVNALVNVAMAAALGLGAVWFSESPAAGGSWTLTAVFSAMLLGSVVAMCWPRNLLPPGQAFVWRRARAFLAGVVELRGNGGRLAWLGVLAATRIAAAGLRLSICFHALGADVSPLAAGILASTSILLTLFNVTPGNLGLRELALAAVAATLGSSYAVGIAAASIDRVVLLGYTVVSGLPGVWSLRRRARGR
jgi:uncharacterized membrane protein YbhN (UPF0104 family)